ncbi:hypothetical protein K7X08_024963 [Anisodus acutangulus]|uniref:Starch synthase, chloroplastic/amyloplastic n=1 Tax=Anisodus acutangulus TaxID=402998 RepID=A0A9Q1RFI5_9SOLA|nr:hypothetical protein K7X08_024963 [Anisodus acutangulus]
MILDLTATQMGSLQTPTNLSNNSCLCVSGSGGQENEKVSEGLLLGSERDGSGSVVGFQLIPHSVAGDATMVGSHDIVADDRDDLSEDAEEMEKTPKLTFNIIFVTAEAAPYSKTGGLGDVCGSLPMALASRGHCVMVVSPRYLNGGRSDEKYANVVDLDVRSTVHCFGGAQEVAFYHEYRAGVDWVFVDHPSYHRPGTPYGDIYGAFGDNQFRFTLLCHAACEAPLVLPLGGFTYGEKCLFLANDWHTALVPLLLAAKYRPYGVYKDARGIVTIHNIAHQGYSWEITTPEGGYGLHELLSSRKSVLNGITNGIDIDDWNPLTDEHIASHYSINDLSGKVECKTALQKELGLPIRPDCPLVMLGSREKQYEDWMRRTENLFKDKFRAWVGFSVPVSHRITAGCDIIVMPCRFEPCGLSQLYAMRYGTIPIVHSTGGLRDTVKDLNPYAQEGKGESTGWAFSPLSSEKLLDTLKVAIGT